MYLIVIWEKIYSLAMWTANKAIIQPDQYNFFVCSVKAEMIWNWFSRERQRSTNRYKFVQPRVWSKQPFYIIQGSHMIYWSKKSTICYVSDQQADTIFSRHVAGWNSLVIRFQKTTNFWSGKSTKCYIFPATWSIKAVIL